MTDGPERSTLARAPSTQGDDRAVGRQLNIKDEALVAKARELASLLGTSATGALRAAVEDRLERERRAREAARKAERIRAIVAALDADLEAEGTRLMTREEGDLFLYDPETGLPW